MAATEITITVSGRSSARLVPIGPSSWRRWDEIDELFKGPEDQAWEAQRHLLDDAMPDPWATR